MIVLVGYGRLLPIIKNLIPTLVEFRLTQIKDGMLLLVTETGFDELPEERKDEAFSMNDKGWELQMLSIKNYLEK